MNVRPSAIAGSWYPDNPKLLTRRLDHYLNQVQDKPANGKLWGIIVPHAGYCYSGGVAAYAFKCLCGLNPDLVVVVSPLHFGHTATLLTTAYDAYQTPLGLVEVDVPAVNKLAGLLQSQSGYELVKLQHDREHSLEIELPFLQHILGQFRLLPVMIRNQRLPIAKALGTALAETIKDQQVLLVASSDLSHFYPQAYADKLDAELLHRVETFDPVGVMDAEVEGVGFACGRGAIAAVLWAARQLGANQVTVLHHATSGDVSGDFDTVVGYGSAVIRQVAEEEPPLA